MKTHQQTIYFERPQKGSLRGSCCRKVSRSGALSTAGPCTPKKMLYVALWRHKPDSVAKCCKVSQSVSKWTLRSFEKGLAVRGGWREEILPMPDILASFLYLFSYAPLGERRHTNPFSKPLETHFMTLHDGKPFSGNKRPFRTPRQITNGTHLDDGWITLLICVRLIS